MTDFTVGLIIYWCGWCMGYVTCLAWRGPRR